MRTLNHDEVDVVSGGFPRAPAEDDEHDGMYRNLPNWLRDMHWYRENQGDRPRW